MTNTAISDTAIGFSEIEDLDVPPAAVAGQPTSGFVRVSYTNVWEATTPTEGDVQLGDGMLSVDPAYAAPEYLPAENSPLIDAGQEIAEVASDIRGVSRPKGVGYDIGAYEVDAVAECGDGNVDDGEQCDDGNIDNTDDCLNSCVEATCGDGFASATEECDDGNQIDDDTCSDACELTEKGTVGGSGGCGVAGFRAGNASAAVLLLATAMLARRRRRGHAGH